MQAKLDVQAIDELYSLIETTSNDTDAHGLRLEPCPEVSHADIIITNVTMRRRLERHVDWNLAVSCPRSRESRPPTENITSNKKQ